MIWWEIKMQHFVEQSELCREMEGFGDGEITVTMETIGMTPDIEADLNTLMNGDMTALHNDIDILLFTHKWRMMKAYDIIREYVKTNIFQNKYHTDVLQNSLCDDICGDMFKTTDDMEKITLIGNVWLMEMAHKNGCPWIEWVCKIAAENGHLDCLMYAHENGCSWNTWTCELAAGGGHIKCLEYAHENGCPWNEWTCSHSAGRGHLECLMYAHENGMIGHVQERQ